MSPNTFGHTLQLQDHRLQADHQVVDPCSYRFSPVNPIDENTPKEASKRTIFFVKRWKNLGERFCFWHGGSFLYNVGVLWSICGKSCGEGKKVRTWLRWYEPQKNSMQQRASGQQYFMRFVCLCRWKLLWEAVQRSGTYFGAKYGKHKMKRLQDGQPWTASWHMEPYDQEGEIRITTPKPSEMVLFRVKVSHPTSQ